MVHILILFIYYPDWIKNKKATTNPENLQYAATVALNYEEIKWNPERVQRLNVYK